MARVTATAYFMQKMLIIKINGTQLPGCCTLARSGMAVILRGSASDHASAAPARAPAAQANGAMPAKPKLPYTPLRDRASMTRGMMHSLRKLTSRARLASTPRYTRKPRMAQT